MIEKFWSRNRVAQVKPEICEPRALQAVIRWCYTARLEISPAHREACLELLHDLGLPELEDKLSEESLEGDRQLDSPNDIHFPLLNCPTESCA